MGRTSSKTANMATVEESTVASVVTEEKNKKVSVEKLMDTDEIQVMSLIPNVSYLDNHTGDFYEWNEAGHEEPMTVETLKNMWRNNKGYFRNMWLKPLCDRVINRFGLTKTYENYDFLMDATNYTRKNLQNVLDTISNTPNGMKFAIVNKIKDMIAQEELTDAFVIKALEKHLNIELMIFL